MKNAIRTMGNSSGALVPKPILVQTGQEDAADSQADNGAMEIRPPMPDRLEGWTADSRRVAQSDDDSLVWPDFANAADAALKW